jgi:hypothetical protein
VSPFGTIHLILTYEMRSFLNVQHILDVLRMATVTCYPVSGSHVSFAQDFGSVTLLIFGIPVSGVSSKNNGVMLPRSQMKET